MDGPARIRASRRAPETEEEIVSGATPTAAQYAQVNGIGMWGDSGALGCTASLIDDDWILLAGHCWVSGRTDILRHPKTSGDPTIDYADTTGSYHICVTQSTGDMAVQLSHSASVPYNATTDVFLTGATDGDGNARNDKVLWSSGIRTFGGVSSHGGIFASMLSWASGSASYFPFGTGQGIRIRKVAPATQSITPPPNGIRAVSTR